MFDHLSTFNEILSKLRHFYLKHECYLLEEKGKDRRFSNDQNQDRTQLRAKYTFTTTDADMNFKLIKLA